MDTTPHQRPSDWIVGTWRSDRDRMLASEPSGGDERAFDDHAREDRSRDDRPVVARALEVRFTDDTRIGAYEGSIVREPYRVVWENDEDLFLVMGADAHERGRLIRFVSPDVFWIHLGPWVEYFSRVQR